VTTTAPPEVRSDAAPPAHVAEESDRSHRLVALVAVAVPTLMIFALMSGIVRGVTLADGFPWIDVDLRWPALLSANTPTGGDTGAHVLLPQVLRDTLLPSGRILGWSNAWYAGFPALYFYFPLPALFTVFLDLFIPYGVAFKVTTIVGLVALPAAIYVFVRGMAFSRVVAGFGAFAGSMFVFMESFSIFGANVKSTLAGEFSFSWSFALSLMYLGVVIKDTREGRGFRPLAAVLLALTALSHVVTTMVVVAVSLPLLLRRGGGRVVTGSWTLGFALSAFWAIPLGVRTLQGYTTDMGWSPVKGILGEGSSPGIVSTPFPDEFIPVAAMALIGVVWTLARRDDVSALLALTILPFLGYLFLPVFGVTKLYNARLLPYWFVGGYILAGIGLGLAVSAATRVFPQRGQNLVAASALSVLALAGLVVSGVHDLPGWVNWNFTGYESKQTVQADGTAIDRWAEYEGLLQTVDELDPGRIMWEINSDQNAYGTPMALMLIPYWSEEHQSMEGVFFESSLTTPFHFLIASEVSRSPSNAVRGLRYRGLNFDRAVPHLALYDMEHYISFTEEAAEAATAAGLEVVAEAPPWTVFDLPDAQRIEPATMLPAVYAGEEPFFDITLDWFDDIAGLDHWVVAEGPEDWPRIDELDQRFSATAPYDVTGAEVTDIEIDDHRIAFRTTAVGVPHLVKVSYFPNWKVVQGAEGPYRAAPSLMVVVPTSEQVVLEFRNTWVENIGTLLTFGGILLIGVWWYVRRRRHRPEVESIA
jgi:hypothetical protein